MVPGGSPQAGRDRVTIIPGAGSLPSWDYSQKGGKSMSREFLFSLACDLVNAYEPYEAGDIIPAYYGMTAEEIAEQIGQILDGI